MAVMAVGEFGSGVPALRKPMRKHLSIGSGPPHSDLNADYAKEQRRDIEVRIERHRLRPQ
jgi:hypothetical protein